MLVSHESEFTKISGAIGEPNQRLYVSKIKIENAGSFISIPRTISGLKCMAIQVGPIHVYEIQLIEEVH